MGPHGGPTSHYRGYTAGTPAEQRGAISRQGPGPRIPVPARRRREVRPPWGRNSVGFLSAGALRLPAVIKSATPMGSTATRHAHRPPRSKQVRSVCTGSPPRRDAIHRVSHRLEGPTQRKNVVAGLRPERVRRDKSRLYAGNTQLRGSTPAHATRDRASLCVALRLF